MRTVLLFLVLILGMVALFAVQNPGIITVRFIHLEGATSLIVVIAASFAAGAVAGILVGIPAALKRRRRAREIEGELAAFRKPKGPPPPVTP